MFLCRLLSPAIVLLAAVSLTPDLSAQRGAMTVQRNLAQLTDRADLIIRGQVISARSEPHPELRGLQTIVVTLRVNERLKGNAADEYTFRQYIWDIRDRYNVAGYGKGQHLLLMMNKPSRLGLTSPVGLEQGRFSIRRDASGVAFAVNGRGNVGLFTNLQQPLQQRKVRLSAGAAKTIGMKHGAVRMEELTEIIRGLVGR